MRAEWTYLKSHFSAEYCKTVLNIALQKETEIAKVGTAGEKDDGVRRSTLRWIYPEDDKLYYIFDHLWRIANWANDTYFDFHITRLSGLQIAEYKSEDQGEYKKHHDVFWYGNSDNKYHRKLSVVVQLSDPNDYTGGDFEFYELFKEYPPKDELRQQGTVIFFPSFTPHAALPVLSGTRYSIAAWFEGPKWR